MTARSTTATSSRLAVGKEVYSADGTMLGHVGHVGRDGFLVRKGFWFLKDSVLPRATIAQVQGKRVLLAISRDEAHRLAATPYDFAEDEGTVADERFGTDERFTEDERFVGGERFTTEERFTGDTADVAASPVRRVRREGAPVRQTVNVIRDAAPALAETATREELAAGEHLTVPVIEEELQAHVRDVDAGRVRVVKTVVDAQETMQVPVRHEEVYVRQRAVYRPATREDLALSERVVEIPVHAQEVLTTKAPVVTGEVDVRKEVLQETEWVTDTVRREEVHVDEDGTGHVHREAPGAGRRAPRARR